MGNPVRFILTGGQRNDITQIEPLLEGFKAKYILADKGYDGQNAIAAVRRCGAIPVIPRRKTTAQWRHLDKNGKIKHFRRIATRYDKLARNYAGFLNLVAALKWAS